MTLIHTSRAKGWRLDDGYQQRLQMAPLSVPEWPLPTPVADPRRPRRVRVRRALRTARAIAAATVWGLLLGGLIFLAIVAPVAYQIGY